MSTERIEKITQALNKAFPDSKISITDNSHLHRGHAGAKDGRGHFKVRIHANELQGLTRIQAHRAIYNALGSLMETDIHALEIELF